MIKTFPAACYYPLALKSFFLACIILVSLVLQAQTNNYFGGSGQVNGAVWSTNAAGPYTSTLNTTGGTIINFGNAATVGGATITIAGIVANANVVWTDGGTLSTGGTVIPVSIANGVTLNMTQALSTAAGTGFIKTGDGVLAIATGSTYSGGFTLNQGTMIAMGINAMGGGTGNILNLNSGIIASDANRDLSGKYSGGINIGGNIQFGDVSGLAGINANLIFNNNILLGAVNRSLSLGNAGTTSLSGTISGTAGITFTANANGTGIFDIVNPANIFTGDITINGGKVRFAADESFGNASNQVVIDGGQLLSTGGGIQHGVQLAGNTSNGINISTGTLTIDGLISNKNTLGSFTKYGAGALVLTNANTYTGTATIDATGGTLQLNRTGGNTIPATNNLVVNGGVLRISSNQAINDLSMPGGNLTVDDNVTLTINGMFNFSQTASITLTGSGRIAYGPLATLKYAGNTAKIISVSEFPIMDGPVNIINENTVGITLPFNRTVTGSMLLSSGKFTIGAGATLDLNGASLSYGTGYLEGNSLNNATSDLMVRGLTGGAVLLSSNGNTGLRNVTIAGNRTFQLNGGNDLNLSGTLSVAGTAVFDNGGESQLNNGGGSPAVIINGKFINRDKDNFTGTNGAIPGIVPVLNAGCTVEYLSSTGITQVVTTRADYSNINFSGSGTCLLGGAFNPFGTVYITGSVTMDAGNHTFGDANTNLIMDGGRFRLSGTNNPQPHISGTYNITGGVIEFACNSISGQTIRNKLYQGIEVTGLYVSNSNGNITLNNNGSFVIKSGGAFAINDNSITAVTATSGQSVVVENNANFLCGNNQGLNGFTATAAANSSIHANITSVSLATGAPGSTVQYTRLGDQPITVANGIVYANLILAGSGIKTAPSSTVTITGNLSKTTAATFEPNNGELVFSNASSSQNISTTSPGFQFYTLTNSNTSTDGLGIINSIGIKNLLNLSANSVLNISSADITLYSTIANTCRVGQVSSSAAIQYNGTGRFIVERCFPADRSWRLITSPLSANNTASTIFSQWQNNGNYSPGVGTFITGANADVTLNGLDASGNNNHSLKAFRNNAYVNVGNTLVPLSGTGLSAANIGYFMFVRGDRNRSPDNTIVPNSNFTTLSSRGKLQTGAQIFAGATRTSADDRNYELIGNPYASPIDFNNVSRANILKRFIVWDPKINQVGGYITFDDIDNNDGVYTQSVASPGGQDKHLQSGQAFFVETAEAMGASSITFEEGSKSAVNNTGMFRPVGTISAFKSTLYLLHADSSLTLADANLAEYADGFNNTVDLQDALKFANPNESFGLLRNAKVIAMERRSNITADDTLFFNLAQTSKRSYKLRFEPVNINPMMLAILEDSYLNTKTAISHLAASGHNFVIGDDAASAAAGRFRLVFKLVDAGVLAVEDVIINAYPQQRNIAVDWSVKDEANIKSYEVMKSIDGTVFKLEHAVALNRQGANAPSHSWLDISPANGYNYYRICLVYKDGKKGLSKIVKVTSNNILPALRVFPNPISNRTAMLEFEDMKAGLYQLRLINGQGTEVFNSKLQHASNRKYSLALPKSLPAGIYQLQVSSPKMQRVLLPVLLK